MYNDNAYNDTRAFEVKELKRLYRKARKQVNEKSASKPVARAVKAFDDHLSKHKVDMKKRKDNLVVCKKARNDIRAASSLIVKEYANKHGKASMKKLQASVYVNSSIFNASEKRRYNFRLKRLKKQVAVAMGFQSSLT